MTTQLCSKHKLALVPGTLGVSATNGDKCNLCDDTGEAYVGGGPCMCDAGKVFIDYLNEFCKRHGLVIVEISTGTE